MLSYYLIYGLKFVSHDGGTNPELAIIPLVLYLFTFIASFLSSKFYLKIGKRGTYTIALVLIVPACSGLLFLKEEYNHLMYFLVMLLGFGESLALNTSTTLISDVIGTESGGAFVYGFYGLIDKTINGLCVYFVMNS